MKIHPAAVLVVAAVAAHSVLTIRQSRKEAHMTVAQMHQRLLSDEENNGELAAVWAGVYEDEAPARFRHINRWISLWGLSYRVGVLSADDVSYYVRNAMDGEAFRAFWNVARPLRLNSARDKTDQEFNKVVDAAYRAACPRVAA
ncbi:DUF6082 family protein [Streptomyces sp. NC-S4]